MSRNLMYLLLAIPIIVVITIIGINKVLPITNSEKLFTEINSKPDNHQCSDIDLSKYMYEYNANELGISQNDLQHITNVADSLKFSNENELISLDKTDAISDINFLFNLLKYSYAGYGYFGGDDTFQNAKENIIECINSYPMDKIASNKLESILVSNTKFIEDGHFNINNKSSLKKYSYYANEEICINKSEKGYYINEDNIKWYIKTINDSFDFDNYLKLSINAEGELCYYIGTLNNSNNNLPITLTLQSNDKEMVKHISLEKFDSETSYSYNNKTSYEYSKETNIPIVTMRRMFDVDADDKSIESFANSAITLKNEPIIILDIRGNYGGQDIGPLTWFKNFTGEMPQIESETIELCSLINNYITTLASKNIDYETLPQYLKKEYNKELERANFTSNKWYISKTEEKLQDNDTKIFVLIDDKVASSGESFISYLKTLKNVVLVGTNTSGVMLSNLYTKSQLPNSHINISFGNTITLIKDFTEGIGFQPDIWINNEDSLNRIFKLLDKNN